MNPVREYQNDATLTHLIQNPITHNWVGLVHGALTLSIATEEDPWALDLSEDALVDPSWLHTSDMQILQLTGLWDDKWEYLVEYREEDLPLTDPLAWPFIKRHMIDYLNEQNVVVGLADTPLLSVFRAYTVQIMKASIHTAQDYAAEQRNRHCMCGSEDFSRNTWHMDEGEVDALECNQCHAGAPLESWLNYWGIGV